MIGIYVYIYATCCNILAPHDHEIGIHIFCICKSYAYIHNDSIMTLIRSHEIDIDIILQAAGITESCQQHQCMHSHVCTSDSLIQLYSNDSNLIRNLLEIHQHKQLL